MASPSLRKLRAALVPGVAVGLLAAAAAGQRGPAVERFEKVLYDARAARAAEDQRASPAVAIVALDDDTIRLAGGTWPVPRGALAAIVDEARRAGARVVAVDLLLQDPLEGSLADENEALERAIAGGGVVLGAAVPRGREAGGPAFRLAPPLPRFEAAAAAVGGVTQEQEEDGRVHALRHVYATDRGEVLSLPLAAAWVARGRPPVRVEGGRLVLGGVAAPLGGDGRVLVRWLGPFDGRAAAEGVYPQVSGADLLRAALAREGEGEPPPAAALAPLGGAVVVLSSTASAAKDKRPTPVNPTAVGGEILATAIDGFLRGAFVARLPPWADAAAALGLAALAALAVGLLGATGAGPAVGAFGAAAAVAAILGGWWALASALVARGTWIAAAAPMGGALLSALAAELRLFAAERRDRRFVHDALGRYTSPALVKTLLDRRELLDRFGGARQELTVYFSDIRGFTTLSEGLEPERLVELLNAYLSAQTEIVERHGGYVDKYVGDAIMAVWGAPVPASDHAARACRAALELRDGLAALRPRWAAEFGVELFARAGVNTCAAVAGNIGSRRKTNYTVLGDGVNLASRLEGANKAFGTEILVGDGTRAAAGDAFAFRSVDLLRVKGKRAGVAVHELVGLAAALPPAELARLATWEGAVADLRARRFERARGAFAALLRDRPGDELCRLYVERCDALLAAPPPPDWDGIHELHEK